MTALEREQVGKTLVVVADFYNKVLSVPQIALYVEALDDLAAGIVVAALTQLLGRSKYFPLPADIREQLALPLEERAEEAWVHAFRNSHAFRDANMSGDATIDEAVSMLGGWREIDDLKYRGVPDIDRRMAKRDFVTYYKITAKRRDHDRLEEIGQGTQKALRP